MPPLPEYADPAELASRLAAQAELLAVSAGLHAIREPARVHELRDLVAEAHELARRGRAVAEHHRRLALAEAAVGRVLDEGLMLADPDFDDDVGFDAARQARAVVSRFLASADRDDSSGTLPH